MDAVAALEAIARKRGCIIKGRGGELDPQTNVATLDSAKLDAALADHKDAVIRTIEAFGTHFAKSAELLNSANNFIPNRLDNLSRAIDYIGSNRSDLQAEFGTGDAARPEGALAQDERGQRLGRQKMQQGDGGGKQHRQCRKTHGAQTGNHRRAAG